MPATPEALFVYGTLRLPEVQTALYDRLVPGCPAELAGWKVFVGHAGYLFARPEPDGVIVGEVVWLTAEELARTDRWEDVPTYQRERVEVVGESGHACQAWVYGRRGVAGRPADGQHLAYVELGEILALIAEVRRGGSSDVG